MNIYNGLDNKLQFQFLQNSIRSKKRFAPWLNTSKIKNLELVKKYFGYSDQRAKEVLNVLTDENISYMKTKLDKGENDGIELNELLKSYFLIFMSSYLTFFIHWTFFNSSICILNIFF